MLKRHKDFLGLKKLISAQGLIVKYTEDGGSRTDTGRGVACQSRTWGSASQQYEMALYMWREIAKKGKRLIYGTVPVECVCKDGIWDPPGDFGEHKINWARPKKIAEAHDKVYL